MYEANHAHTRRLGEATQEQALARVREALTTEGFGDLTCNSGLAYKALRPRVLFRVVDTPAVRPIAEEVDARLQRVQERHSP